MYSIKNEYSFINTIFARYWIWRNTIWAPCIYSKKNWLYPKKSLKGPYRCSTIVRCSCLIFMYLYAMWLWIMWIFISFLHYYSEPKTQSSKKGILIFWEEKWDGTNGKKVGTKAKCQRNTLRYVLKLTTESWHFFTFLVYHHYESVLF